MCGFFISSRFFGTIMFENLIDIDEKLSRLEQQLSDPKVLADQMGKKIIDLHPGGPRNSSQIIRPSNPHLASP